MGFYYIFIALTFICLLFLFTKNNKEYAFLSFIPFFVLFFSIVINYSDDGSDIVKKYNIYKDIDIATYEDAETKVNIAKEIININETIEYERSLVDNWFLSDFVNEKVADLEYIELKI